MTRPMTRQMKMTVALLAAATMAGLSATAAASEPMKTGNWEMSIHATNAGQPPTDFTSAQCMTTEQLESHFIPAPVVPPEKRHVDYDINMSEEDCSYHISQKGNAVHIESNCSGEKSVADAVYTVDTLSVKAVTTGGDMPGTMDLRGKRLGDCEKKI